MQNKQTNKPLPRNHKSYLQNVYITSCFFFFFLIYLVGWDSLGTMSQMLEEYHY